MEPLIREHRMRAALASGGTSDDAIKRLVVRLVGDLGLRGRFLDFGAGRGELSRRLMGLGGVERVTAVDILDPPGGLPPGVEWHVQDLNDPLGPAGPFDVVVCSEVIEHLENPRFTFRGMARALRPGGTLILTTPNQESLRSLVALLLRGHFVQFLGDCYPAHITALLRLDLERICAETGFNRPAFSYTDSGGIPKRPTVKWQSISFGLLKGRLFSDNIGMVARRRDDAP